MQSSVFQKLSNELEGSLTFEKNNILESFHAHSTKEYLFMNENDISVEK